MSVQYKGVNLSGLEFGKGMRPYYDYISPGSEHFNYWSQHVGANIVRIPFKWERLQTESGGGLEQGYLNFLKDAVRNAEANGMTVILDLHNYGHYKNQQLTDATGLSDIWSRIAQEFGNNSSVWFNLMNEPNGISADTWKTITQQVVINLREDGVENKLLLSGTAWSGAHSWISSGNAAMYADFFDPSNNYAFDVHQYLDTYSTGTHGKAAAGVGESSLKAITAWAEEHGHTLFLGETGAADHTLPGQELAFSEMADLLQFMEDHADTWLGWTLWGAGPWWPENYHFNINPKDMNSENPVTSSIIENLKEWFSTIPVESNLPSEEKIADAIIGTDTDDILYGDYIFTDKSDADARQKFSDQNSVYTERKGVKQTDTDLGVKHGDFDLAQDSIVTLTFKKSWASYKNTLGIYSILEDGTISNVSIVFENALGVQAGTEHSVVMAGGENIAFGLFILSNGFGRNNSYSDIDLSKLSFIYNYGKSDERLAKITDQGLHVSLVYRDGENSLLLKGDLYHATDNGGYSGINADKKIHVQTGMSEHENDHSLKVGFEDFYNLGDSDFNDVVFDVTISPLSSAYNDVIDGGAGNDMIYGGYGHDILTGGAGQDTFLYKSLQEGGDTITDFQIGKNGDTLDIRDVLQGYDLEAQALEDIIQIALTNQDAVISIQNPDSNTAYTVLATMTGVGEIDLATLIHDGNILI